jgi:hypothetical protein
LAPLYVVLAGEEVGWSRAALSLAIDLFQGKHDGAILGFLEIGSGLGSSVGPW